MFHTAAVQSASGQNTLFQLHCADSDIFAMKASDSLSESSFDLLSFIAQKV